MNFEHVSVMLMPTVDMLDVREGGVYVDGTLGGGGHSAEILRRLNGTGHLYGIDRDNDALAAATERLGAAGNFTAVKGNFHDVKALLAERGVGKIDGMMIDLGVSSHQLDTAERGFSYHADAPLDMRMDQDQPLTAREIVNTWSAAEITRILRDYSEEKWAARIAQIICEHRAQKPLETTGDLVACVDAAIPKKVRMQDSGHSARRTFQALRIAVNDELDPLKKALEDMVELLNPGRSGGWRIPAPARRKSRCASAAKSRSCAFWAAAESSRTRRRSSATRAPEARCCAAARSWRRRANAMRAIKRAILSERENGSRTVDKKLFSPRRGENSPFRK